MKVKLLLIALLSACVVLTAKSGWTAIYTFQPTPKDIYDLDHYYYYSWGMNLALQPNEVVESATLSIKNINNWTVENDVLYIHLLDQANLGVTSFYDNQGGGDNLTSWPTAQILLDQFTDTNDYPGPAENYAYNFDSYELLTLNNYINNNNVFGLGFDPDCHYWNDGVKLKLTTRVVPEPTTMILFATGAAGAFLRKRKNLVS